MFAVYATHADPENPLVRLVTEVTLPAGSVKLCNWPFWLAA